MKYIQREHNISNFCYNKDINSFVIGTLDYNISDIGKQFFICNSTTNNKVRFRLHRKKNNMYHYVSEIGIDCIILENVNYI